MAAETGGQEKTETPTERRLADSRKKGDVPKSMELPAAAVLLCGLLVLYFSGDFILERLFLLLRYYLGNLHTFEIVSANMPALAAEVMFHMAVLLGPLMAVLLLAALASNYAQVGVLFTTEKITPSYNKIDPIQGFQRIFSLQTLATTFKSIAKLYIVGYVAYTEVKDSLNGIIPLMDQDPNQILIFIAHISFLIFLKAGLVIALLAFLDYAFQRWQFMEKMMMTKQEIKEEAKQTEGDPHVKGRIRAIQMEMARKRMMAEIPSADVVITNPTHLAIALRYDSTSMAAPMVVAKGAGVIAHRIKEIAMEHHIVIVEDRPLAQALYKTAGVNEMVPEDLFQAVAEVLAYVYSLRRKSA